MKEQGGQGFKDSRSQRRTSLKKKIFVLRCKDSNSAGARGRMRVWWENHQTIECRLIIKSSSCETSTRSGWIEY